MVFAVYTIHQFAVTVCARKLIQNVIADLVCQAVNPGTASLLLDLRLIGSILPRLGDAEIASCLSARSRERICSCLPCLRS